MKVSVIRIVLLSLFVGVISSCTQQQPDLTRGAVDLLKSYDKILSKKDTCSLPHHSKIYAVNAVMSAEFYMKPNGKDTLVTYSASINTDYPNAIFTNWECSAQRYINNTICPPKVIHFPYVCDTTEIKAPFLAKFMEIETLQKLKPATKELTSANNKLTFISLTDIETIASYHLEERGGFIDRTYHERYIDPTAELGIICDLKLKSGAVKHCYILTDYLGTVHWKNPMH